MKSRKSYLPNRSSFFLAIVLAVFANFNYSCNGSCAGFDCVKGDCKDGACVCEEGYEGTTCNTAWSAKFVGTYQGTDCYDSGIARYTISGTAKADSVRYDNKYYALVKGGTDLIFPDQKTQIDGVEFIFSGTGKITNNGLNLLLFSKYPTFEVKCELELTRVN